jgi:hypothetical protein
MIAAAIALLVRLLALVLQAAADDDPDLNVLQYVLPVATILMAGSMLGGKGARRSRHSLGPSVLSEA